MENKDVANEYEEFTRDLREACDRRYAQKKPTGIQEAMQLIRDAYQEVERMHPAKIELVAELNQIQDKLPENFKEFRGGIFPNFGSEGKVRLTREEVEVLKKAGTYTAHRALYLK